MIFYKLKKGYPSYSGYGSVEKQSEIVEPSGPAFQSMSSPSFFVSKQMSATDMARRATATLGQDEVLVLPDDSTSDKFSATSGTEVPSSDLAVYDASVEGEGSADMVQVTEDDLTEKWWNWKSFAIGVGSGIGFAGLIWIISSMTRKRRK